MCPEVLRGPSRTISPERCLSWACALSLLRRGCLERLASSQYVLTPHPAHTPCCCVLYGKSFRNSFRLLLALSYPFLFILDEFLDVSRVGLFVWNCMFLYEFVLHVWKAIMGFRVLLARVCFVYFVLLLCIIQVLWFLTFCFQFFCYFSIVFCPCRVFSANSMVCKCFCPLHFFNEFSISSIFVWYFNIHLAYYVIFGQ